MREQMDGAEEKRTEPTKTKGPSRKTKFMMHLLAFCFLKDHGRPRWARAVHVFEAIDAEKLVPLLTSDGYMERTTISCRRKQRTALIGNLSLALLFPQRRLEVRFLCYSHDHRRRLHYFKTRVHVRYGKAKRKSTKKADRTGFEPARPKANSFQGCPNNHSRIYPYV